MLINIFLCVIEWKSIPKDWSQVSLVSCTVLRSPWWVTFALIKSPSALRKCPLMPFTSQLVLVGGALQAGRWTRTLESFMWASPVRAHIVVIPQRGRLCVAHPLRVPGVMAGLHQKGVCGIRLQIPIGKMGFVLLTIERKHQNKTL